MERSIDSQVRSDIANETVRHYGEIPENFPQRMRNRPKRKFRTDLDVSTISRLANQFKEIYNFGASILKDFISPKTGGYAIPADVDIERFTAAVVKQYPEEEKQILEGIRDWVIYYEYLR